jgi:hypothetical protein
MTATNEITGDKLISKPSNKAYEEGWEEIFNKEQPKEDTTDGDKTDETQDL